MSRSRSNARRYELSARAECQKLKPPLARAAATGAEAGFTPFRELDELIAHGYGDVPQTAIPRDWKTRPRRDEPRAP